MSVTTCTHSGALVTMKLVVVIVVDVLLGDHDGVVNPGQDMAMQVNSANLCYNLYR